jgi:hypothetical protein
MGLGQQAAPSAAAPPVPAATGGAADSVSWLDQVAVLAGGGDRAGAIALYRENMAADEQEAASFVDDLIAHPPSGS